MRRINNNRCILIIIALFMLFLNRCGTVNVPMRVTHPAEINMNPYKQVALSDIEGNMVQSVEDDIKNQLIESGRFQVVERSRLEQIMKELNLSQSDLADESNRAKLGKLMAASSMIAGNANGKYDEKLTYEDSTCTNYQTKQKYACKYYYRKGVFKTSGSLDVIDIQTGQIIKSKLFNNTCEKTNSAIDAYPESIDKDELGSECLTKNVTAFMKAISPWTEMVNAPFQTDKAIPDLQQGINKAKMGDLQDAVNVFASAAKAAEGNAQIKPQSIAKSYFNLGLAYQYTEEFDKAIEAFKKAYSLHPSDMFMKEKNNCEKLKAEKRKLQEQGI